MKAALYSAGRRRHHAARAKMNISNCTIILFRLPTSEADVKMSVGVRVSMGVPKSGLVMLGVGLPDAVPVAMGVREAELVMVGLGLPDAVRVAMGVREALSVMLGVRLTDAVRVGIGVLVLHSSGTVGSTSVTQPVVVKDTEPLLLRESTSNTQ
jgi:hypothetical protein